MLDDERLMLRAVTLLSKVFLHHLNTLLTLPNFSVLWLRALELLQSYLRAPNNETLFEAVPETLKNLLLVMGSTPLAPRPARPTPPGTPPDGTAPHTPEPSLLGTDWTLFVRLASAQRRVPSTPTRALASSLSQR